MGSRMKHAIRSHRGYRERQIMARRFLRGSLPWNAWQVLMAAARNRGIEPEIVEENTDAEDGE